MSRFLACSVLVVVAHALSACGGGSGSDSGAVGGSPSGGSSFAVGGTSTPGGTGGTHGSTGGAGGTATTAAGTSVVSSGGTRAIGGTAATGGAQVTTGGTVVAGGTQSTGGTSSAAVGGTRTTTGGTSSAGGTQATTGGTSSVGGGTTSITSTAGGVGGIGGAVTGGTSSVTGTTGGLGNTGGAAACPTSRDNVGNSSWKHELVVTSGAQYCGEQNEMRTLEQELATKAKLTIAPGTYPLPETAGTYDFALPVCFDLGKRGVAPVFAGAGQVQTTRTTNPPISYTAYAHEFNQPLTSADSGRWSFRRYISYWNMLGTEPVPDTLDGSVLFQWGDNGYNSMLQLCEGDFCDEWNDITFAACDPPFKLYRHTVTFDGGQAVLDVRIDGAVGVAAMPAAFVAARGTLDGSTFTQHDYWKLVYSAPHHHFIRSFAILFDAPINGACGLKVLDVDPYDRALPEVFTIECDLSNIAAHTVSAATTELP